MHFSAGVLIKYQILLSLSVLASRRRAAESLAKVGHHTNRADLSEYPINKIAQQIL
jgi:hypothetical protein